MPISRYNNTSLIRNPSLYEPVHYSTYDLPSLLKGYAQVDWFGSEVPLQHVWVVGDRMDKLASRYFGEDSYWWVIALVNGIGNPLAVSPGTILLIPQNVNDIFQKLGLR